MINEFCKGPRALQQSLGCFLGYLSYGSYPQMLLPAIQCLTESVDLNVSHERLDHSALSSHRS
jgi:hypothetical protein